MARVRTFIAVDAGHEIHSAGEKLIRTLASSSAEIRWVRPQNIHLTLKFLGEVDDRELHDVCRHTCSVAAEAKRFSLSCRSLGAFPNNSKPNTIWMGVEDEHKYLDTLQHQLEESLSEIGFPIERRAFKGHLTLGRTRSNRMGYPALVEMIRNQADSDFGLLQVNELVVYSSELNRDGPVYTVLGRCPLALA